MKLSQKRRRCRKSPPGWHAAFEAMVPIIEMHAKIAFRHLNPEARDEAVQETVCNACCAYARLVELNKAEVAYPSVLARFGVAQTKEGRKVGGHLRVSDVLSEYCWHQKGIVVERLDEYDGAEDCWQEIVVEDKHAGPAEVAATRVDFAAWLQGLPRRLQQIALFLAKGETTSTAARRFCISPGRLSQLRKQLFLTWCQFQGDEAAMATA